MENVMLEHITFHALLPKLELHIPPGQPQPCAIPGVMHAAIVSNAPGLDAARQQIELEHAPVDDPTQRPLDRARCSVPGMNS